MKEDNINYKWNKVFLSKYTEYVLLDDCGDIRATAWGLEGIVKAKEYYGWGTIHKVKFEGRTIKIGRVIK